MQIKIQNVYTYFQSNRNQILFTIFRLVGNQTEDNLVPNQLENGKYNLTSTL